MYDCPREECVLVTVFQGCHLSVCKIMVSGCWTSITDQVVTDSDGHM